MRISGFGGSVWADLHLTYFSPFRCHLHSLFVTQISLSYGINKRLQLRHSRNCISIKFYGLNMTLVVAAQEGTLRLQKTHTTGRKLINFCLPQLKCKTFKDCNTNGHLTLITMHSKNAGAFCVNLSNYRHFAPLSNQIRKNFSTNV